MKIKKTSRYDVAIFLRAYHLCIASKRDLEPYLNEEHPSEDALEILRIFIDAEYAKEETRKSNSSEAID